MLTEEHELKLRYLERARMEYGRLGYVEIAYPVTAANVVDAVQLVDIDPTEFYAWVRAWVRVSEKDLLP